jgi:hypothetical protein
VEVDGTRLSAMTYVGHGIRASVAQTAEQHSAPSHQECFSAAITPARRLRAPCADEH